MTNESWLGRCMIACATLWWLQMATPVWAQTPLRAALFKTAAEQGGLTPLAAALDPVLAELVGKASQVTIVATPALDLPSLQLAIDCVGETPSCLALAAERSGSDGVLAPSLSRTDTEIVVSLLFYDPQRAAGPMRVLTKRVPRKAGDSAVLSGGTALVDELFGALPAAPEAAPPTPPMAAEPQPVPDSLLEPEPMPERSPSLIAPLVLGAVGVVGLGTGIAFGLAANHSESTYGAMHVKTEADASRALDRYDSAARSATIANISLGVGAAALVAGAVVWFVQRPRSSERASATRTRLALTPNGVALQGGWP